MWHEWGDDDFDFGLLNKAGGWIALQYHKKTGQYMVWKEKYGTIRYELIFLWARTSKDIETWLKIVKKATKKFPTIAAEIVDDIHLSDNKEVAAYKEYFDSIIDKNK